MMHISGNVLILFCRKCAPPMCHPSSDYATMSFTANQIALYDYNFQSKLNLLAAKAPKKGNNNATTTTTQQQPICMYAYIVRRANAVQNIDSIHL